MDKDLYADKCKAFFEFMIKQNQWSGITYADVSKWLNNFSDLEDDEMHFVFKLMSRIIYFSEKDIIDALKNGVYSCISYDYILKQQIANDFQLSNNALKSMCEEQISKSIFVPLLDSDSPYESGNYIMRLLVQQNLVPQTNCVFLDKIPEILKFIKFDKLIIVDDCIGSGQQITEFYKKINSFLKKNPDIHEYCNENEIELKYLVLFGYDESIKIISDELKELKICCVRLLKDRQRVFSDLSYVWENKTERDAAYNLLSKITYQSGIPLLGYNNLDFAFIMHKTIPDWTLPLFWKENSNWNLLVRRKDSND